MSTPSASIQQPAGGPAPQNGMGTAALVFGILHFFCFPVIGAVLAIIFGKIGMNKAEQGLATNGGVAKAGFILGIIGAILTVIGIVVYIVVFAAAAGSGSMN